MSTSLSRTPRRVRVRQYQVRQFKLHPDPGRPELDVRAYVCGNPAAPLPAGAAVPVLLHGIGMTHRTFAPVQRLLARGGPVISFDLAGFGPTRRPSHTLTVAEQAALAGRALDLLGVGRRTLVGHSMGAQFAVELALQQPELTSAVVLIGPVVDTARRRLRHQAWNLLRDTWREPPAANAVVLTAYLRCGLRWYLRNLRQMFAYDTQDAVRRLAVPVLVLRGAKDPIARLGWCQRLAGAAPAGGRVLVVRRRAHVNPYTAPRQVAAAIAWAGTDRVRSSELPLVETPCSA